MTYQIPTLPTLFLRLSHFLIKGSSFTKIRPQAKIDNFAFKNSNIIIEGRILKRKDSFSWKKFETQKNNFIKKYYFCPNLFSYRFEPNFKKLCDSNKSRFIFLGKRFSTNMIASYFWNRINYYQIQQFFYKNFVLQNCFCKLLHYIELLAKQGAAISYSFQKNIHKFFFIDDSNSKC